MQQYRYLPFEPIVGNVRKVGETVFMAEILIKPEELSNIVPARFNVISDTAYVIMTEASLRDEKARIMILLIQYIHSIIKAAFWLK